jgi:hypothetical protein
MRPYYAHRPKHTASNVVARQHARSGNHRGSSEAKARDMKWYDFASRLAAAQIKRRRCVPSLLVLCLVAMLSSRALAVDDRQWYVRGTDPVDLIHGVKETDDQDFFAGCKPGSGDVLIIVTQQVGSLTDGGTVPVDVAIDSRSRRYVARGMVNQSLGVPVPTIRIPANDPLLDWMAAGYNIRITIADAFDKHLSLHGSAHAVRRFIAACRA